MRPDEPAALTALACLDVQLEHLLTVADGNLDQLPSEQLILFTQRFERLRRRLSLVDHQIVAALESREVPARHGVRSTQRFLAQMLRIGHGEAKQRVEAAHDLLPQLTSTGETLAVKRPLVAVAQRAGEISADHTQVMLRGLDRLDRLAVLGHDVASAGDRPGGLEGELVELAGSFDPTELRRCVERMVECVDPDGVLADERAQQAQRELHLIPRRDGMYSLRGVLTAQVGASLSAVLVPLAAKRPTCEAEGPVVGVDDRDYPARLHDALDDATQRLLRSGSLPVTGGVPATVLISVDADDLTHNREFARAADGTLIPVRQLPGWADAAEVVTVAVSTGGGVLELGRQKRFATQNQTLALIARDEACTFPGCDHPPQWCDHHHVRGWLAGGPTNIDNLTLLCRYHHHRFEHLGWDCQMIDGLPHWIPPRWADPEQKPILNQRLRTRRDRRSHRPAPKMITHATTQSVLPRLPEPGRVLEPV